MKRVDTMTIETENHEIESTSHAVPVILVLLSAGSIDLLDVATRQSFRMSTTVHIGAALELIKHCPFSHARVAVDDENTAAEILQTALRTSGFVDSHQPCVLVIRPAPQFVNDISKTELISLSAMVAKTGFNVIETQFFLKTTIESEDWAYFEALQNQHNEVDLPTPHYPQESDSLMTHLRNMFTKYL